MIQKFTKLEFESAKYNDMLEFECEHCHFPFYNSKNYVSYALAHPGCSRTCRYCSVECRIAAKKTKKEVVCNNCSMSFIKLESQLRSVNNFCSKSCAATYNNKHKKHGTRISKLEQWLQEQLTMVYSNLEIHYNRKDAINSELDIYIPSLQLAFELNGIFHYEPIFGIDKLTRTKNNDVSKSKACFDNKIDLCIIDVSGQTYFKPESSIKYLKIITTIINNYKSSSEGFEPSFA